MNVDSSETDRSRLLWLTSEDIPNPSPENIFPSVCEYRRLCRWLNFNASPTRTRIPDIKFCSTQFTISFHSLRDIESKERTFFGAKQHDRISQDGEDQIGAST